MKLKSSGSSLQASGLKSNCSFLPFSAPLASPCYFSVSYHPSLTPRLASATPLCHSLHSQCSLFSRLEARTEGIPIGGVLREPPTFDERSRERREKEAEMRLVFYPGSSTFPSSQEMDSSQASTLSFPSLSKRPKTTHELIVHTSEHCIQLPSLSARTSTVWKTKS